jgi:hypothetical protein
VRLSLGASTEYDSNVFREPSDEKGDVVFRVSPQVAVVEDREQFNYSVSYMLPYEIGVKYSEVRDLNHLVGANFRYRATPQTELFGNNAFFYVRGLYGRDQSLEDETLGDVGDGRDRVLSNSLSLGATHHFSPRLSGTIVATNGIYDTDQFNRANSLSFGASASSAYQLTEQHELGGGFSYARQSFDDTINRPSSDTDYYNLFGSWAWVFDETTIFSIRAGPALIHSNQQAASNTVPDQEPIPFTVTGTDGSGNPTEISVSAFNGCPVQAGNTALFDNAGSICPQILVSDPGVIADITSRPEIDFVYLSGQMPESVKDTRITYFASAGITKRWTPTIVSSLNYVRQDDAASGIDGGATLDAVTLSTSWRISDRWDAAVRADWTLRESATNGARVFVSAFSENVPGIPIPVASACPAGPPCATLFEDESPDSLDTQRWGAAARIAYRLTKNTVTSLQYAYNKQSSNGDTVGVSSDFDDHLVTFTVQYNFEPIGLWW